MHIGSLGRLKAQATILNALLCFALLNRAVHAQGIEPRFEVTSVKLNNLPPRSRIPEFSCQGGRFVSRAHYIDLAIRYAYQIESFQLSGLPNWVDSNEDVYDIEGRANPYTTETQCREMVRRLLSDRFKLTIRRETREVPVLALIVEKNGPKIRQVGANDGENGPGFVINGTPMQMFDRQLRGWTMAQLVQALGIANLGSPIIEKTGLEGQYRISLSLVNAGPRAKILM